MNTKPAKLKTRTFETADLTIADDSLHWLGGSLLTPTSIQEQCGDASDKNSSELVFRVKFSVRYAEISDHLAHHLPNSSFTLLLICYQYPLRNEYSRSLHQMLTSPVNFMASAMYCCSAC